MYLYKYKVIVPNLQKLILYFNYTIVYTTQLLNYLIYMELLHLNER